MRLPYLLIFLLSASLIPVEGQSGRVGGYSESGPTRIAPRPPHTDTVKNTEPRLDAADVIRVPTDLVTIPVRIASLDGKPVTGVARGEFKIFEDGVEQDIAYFSDDEQPFTVALVLDMSYSSAFKLDEIQTAARIFVSKLRQADRVMVVSFDEKARVLCEPTNDRRVLRLAIESSEIGSGTALYDTLDTVLGLKLATVSGRRAIVVLGDGVDTSSVTAGARMVEQKFLGGDVIVYPIQYDTFDDVQKSKRKDAEIRFDDNDRPYVVSSPPKKGEREQDYESARAFFKNISAFTGGRVYRVTSTTNLNAAFSNIADELRKIYSVGYYPAGDRKSGAAYDIKVRVYRPNLKITARNRYVGR